MIASPIRGLSMKSFRLSSVLFAAVYLSASVACAATVMEVADGCAVPSSAPPAHVFYIDPVNGSMSGDGSLAHPWNSLEAITGTTYGQPAWQPPGCAGYNNTSCTYGPLLTSEPYWHYDARVQIWTTSTNPNAPISPGDSILLMSGNYGNVALNGVVNSSFITIEAATGQKPVLSNLTLLGSTKWLIRGLTFQGLASGYSGFLYVAGNARWGTSSDIVFVGNSLSSQTNVSKWSATDWINKARSNAIDVDGGDPYSTDANCVSISDNVIKNVRSGIVMMANNMLVSRNTIDNFGDDALDYAGNNLVISHNTIKNSHTLGDSNHNDAMQGFIGRGVPGTTVYDNILIDSNTVIRQTEPRLPLAGTLQGIDAFDMDWSNVVVTNNVVVSNGYHGISFYSLHGGWIENNTVLYDGVPNAATLWILVGNTSHEGSSSNNVVVRNNTATFITNDGWPATEFDHNLSGQGYVLNVNGQQQGFYAPGTYVGGNIVDSDGLQKVFVGYDLVHRLYNLNLRPGSSAVGTGNLQNAPPDRSGHPRKAPVDLGAYVFKETTP
jgi:parallel beta-helix repeat protein